MHLPERKPNGHPWSPYLVLSGGDRRRLEAFEAMLHDQGRSRPSLFVSLSQNTSHCRPTTTIPTLTRNTMLWSMQRRRIILPLEHLELQGLRVYGDDPSPHKCVRCIRASQELVGKARQLAGNMMHAGQLAAVMLTMFCLTEVRRG